jgi:hypothetical protein
MKEVDRRIRANASANEASALLDVWWRVGHAHILPHIDLRTRAVLRATCATQRACVPAERSLVLEALALLDVEPRLDLLAARCDRTNKCKVVILAPLGAHGGVPSAHGAADAANLRLINTWFCNGVGERERRSATREWQVVFPDGNITPSGSGAPGADNRGALQRRIARAMYPVRGPTTRSIVLLDLEHRARAAGGVVLRACDSPLACVQA